jgi:hypothetical protein
MLFPISVKIAGFHRIIVGMPNTVDFAGMAPRGIAGLLVSLFWETAFFVFLATPARTGIVPLCFHEGCFSL